MDNKRDIDQRSWNFFFAMLNLEPRRSIAKKIAIFTILNE